MSLRWLAAASMALPPVGPAAAAGIEDVPGDAAPRAEHAAEALRLAEGVERMADGLGDLRARARVLHDGADTWLLARAELELR